VARRLEREGARATSLLGRPRHAGLAGPADRRLLPLHAVSNRLRVAPTRRPAARRLVHGDEDPAFVTHQAESAGDAAGVRGGPGEFLAGRCS